MIARAFYLCGVVRYAITAALRSSVACLGVSCRKTGSPNHAATSLTRVSVYCRAVGGAFRAFSDRILPIRCDDPSLTTQVL